MAGACTDSARLPRRVGRLSELWASTVSILPNLLLLGAWLGTHMGALAWIAAHYFHADRRLEALSVVAVVVLAWHRFGGPLPALRRLAGPATTALAPLALLAACVVIEGASARWLALHLVEASTFLLGGYALVGLYAPPSTWRAALPWVALLTLTLPFGAFAEVYLGFPARVMTAALVRDGLDRLGVVTLATETILVFDHGRAVQVDAPCAGVRSLWSAGVFLLAAACVEGRSLDRWFAAAAVVTGGLLLATNTLRVATIVVLGSVLDAPSIADAVHVPLGLFGFAGAAAGGWLLMRRGALPVEVPQLARRGAPLLAPILATGILMIATPSASAEPTTLPFALALPARLVASPIAPGTAELAFFAGVGVPAPEKWKFVADQGSGSLLVVPSRSWRAHHLPSSCLLGQGHAVEGLRTLAIDPSFAVRVARVDDGAATAVWWFQAPGRSTEDLSVRTWAALSGEEDRWVLVSILLEGSVPPDTVAPLVRALRTAVHCGLDPAAKEAICSQPV